MKLTFLKGDKLIFSDYVVTVLVIFALWCLLTRPAEGALPPMPVVRPKPLQSPRAASAPKSTPMLRTFAPASVPFTGPASPMRIMVRINWNIFQCDLTDPNCVLYDQTHVAVNHMAGTELTLYIADTVNAAEWSKVGFSSAGTMDRVYEWAQILPVGYRSQARFFRTMVTTPILPPSRSATPVVWWDMNMPGTKAWSTKK